MNSFMKAAVITIAVFIAGLAVGIWFDNSRVEETREAITKMDIGFNDARLQNLYYQVFSNEPGFCDTAVQSNFDFSSEIYKEGVEMEKFEKVNRFASQLVQQKKRYALLQLQYWLNSIYLREKCGKNYTTLLYFYSHYDESLGNDQKLQSSAIIELLDRCGHKLVTAPIPIDLDVGMVNLIKEKHGISTAPSLLINEDVVLEGVHPMEELEKYVSC